MGKDIIVVEIKCTAKEVEFDLVKKAIKKIRQAISSISDFEIKTGNVRCLFNPVYADFNSLGKGEMICQYYKTPGYATLDMDWKSWAHMRVEEVLKKFFPGIPIHHIN